MFIVQYIIRLDGHVVAKKGSKLKKRAFMPRWGFLRKGLVHVQIMFSSLITFPTFLLYIFLQLVTQTHPFLHSSIYWTPVLLCRGWFTQHPQLTGLNNLIWLSHPPTPSWTTGHHIKLCIIMWLVKPLKTSAKYGPFIYVSGCIYREGVWFKTVHTHIICLWLVTHVVR